MTGNDGIRAENIVWIFGTGRSGSTWLGSMMGDSSRSLLWNEPLVGRLFGEFYANIAPRASGRGTFVMSEANRSTWLKSIRTFVLDGATVRFPELPESGCLVIKEPNGSVGASLLMEALPESRMILLVRDPRDVVASALDGHRKGGHAHKRASRDLRRPGTTDTNRADDKPNAFVRGQANRYLQNVGHAREAYEAHEGPKALVRYEELRDDTLHTMKHLYSTLEIAVDEGELGRTVERHAWENVPEQKKGQGKFYRKASPGGWREDLTPKQVEIVERITGTLLKEFYAEA